MVDRKATTRRTPVAKRKTDETGTTMNTIIVAEASAEDAEVDDIASAVEEAVDVMMTEEDETAVGMLTEEDEMVVAMVTETEDPFSVMPLIGCPVEEGLEMDLIDGGTIVIGVMVLRDEVAAEEEVEVDETLVAGGNPLVVAIASLGIVVVETNTKKMISCRWMVDVVAEDAADVAVEEDPVQMVLTREHDTMKSMVMRITMTKAPDTVLMMAMRGIPTLRQGEEDVDEAEAFP